MTRIVSGAAGGRRLDVPGGGATRPTSDRAREGLFSTLESLCGLAGSRFADLYAGSGAVGLEALSRGAAHVLLVEADATALRVLRANIHRLELAGASVAAGKVSTVVSRPPPGGAYDVVFLDPPYELGDAAVRGVLEAMHVNGWVAAGAVLAVERATRGGELAWPDGVAAQRSRRYGEATLWYGRATW